MEIAVSMIEAEYVALNTSMCALISLHTHVNEVKHLLDPFSKSSFLYNIHNNLRRQ